MAGAGDVESQPRLRVRAELADEWRTSIETGVPVLDHLLSLLAEYGGFELELQVEPGGSAAAEVAPAGRALGEALAGALHAPDARRIGSAAVPADEALAHVALEASGRPRVVSNVDLSDARVAGLRSDLVADFLRELAEGGGLTLHVRLIEGSEAQHVLEAIFKALGIALAQACRPRSRKE
jgi:imidazoleglycerol-phosphate dehydratase